MYNTEKEKLLSQLPVDFKNAYIAGGAVRSVFTNQPIADLDIYFKSKEAFKSGVRDAIDNGLYLVDVSKRALTFVNGDTVVQLCATGFYELPQSVFDSFDFTCCMGLFDLDNENFVLHEDFLKHNSQRFLKFNPKTKYPIASMLRVLKYQQKGYTIGKGELLKILFATREIPLESWDDVREQIGGAYGHAVLIECEDKDFSVDTLIDSLDDKLNFTRVSSNVPPYIWDADYADVILKAMGMLDLTFN